MKKLLFTLLFLLPFITKAQLTYDVTVNSIEMNIVGVTDASLNVTSTVYAYAVWGQDIRFDGFTTSTIKFHPDQIRNINGATIAQPTTATRIVQILDSVIATLATGGSTDTTSLSTRIDARVKYTDTTSMLSTYLRKTDTTSLSTRIDTKAGLSVSNTFTERQLITPPSLTGSSATSALSIAQTWNTTGNPSAIFLNVTNTASGATATLMDLQVGGVSQLSISKAGAIVTAAGITSTATIQQSSTSDFRWNNRSRMFSDANGNIRFSNSALTDFGLLQFGGTSSSFPAIKRSTTTLQVRLADDSGFAFIESLYERAGSGSPEGVVTAPVGAIYHRTDGGAGTSNYFKESGSGSTGWIAK